MLCNLLSSDSGYYSTLLQKGAHESITNNAYLDPHSRPEILIASASCGGLIPGKMPFMESVLDYRDIWVTHGDICVCICISSV